MKVILVVLVAILVAIPVLAVLGKALKLLAFDLPRTHPRLGFSVIGFGVLGFMWLAWRYAAVHHHRWR